MPYDFRDPQQANQFRQKAMSQGYKLDEVENYIAAKTQQSYASQYGYTPTGKVNVPESTEPLALSEMKEQETKMFNARIGAQKALNLLDEGVSAGPIASRLAGVKDFLGMPSKTTDYKAAINLAASQLFNALAGATQSEVELERLNKLMPTENDQEATAKRKLMVLTELLDQQMAMKGYDVSALSFGQSTQESGISPTDMAMQETEEYAPVVIGISGEAARQGDLYRDEDGSLRIFGDAKETFSKPKDLGFTVDNSVIRFLADNEFLPIVGGVVGGITGGVAGSAGGSMTGKMLQQGLRELLDPDAQDLGDHAKAIATEGMVDALFSGLTLGIGKGGKLIMKRIGSESLQEVGEKGLKKLGFDIINPGDGIDKILSPGKVTFDAASGSYAFAPAVSNVSDEAFEKAVKEVAEKEAKIASETTLQGLESWNTLERARNLKKSVSGNKIAEAAYKRAKTELKNTLPFTPTQRADFLSNWGAEIEDVILASGQIPKNIDELTTLGRTLSRESGKELSTILSKSTANPDDVIAIFNKTKANQMVDGIASPGTEESFSLLDKYIKTAEKYKELNRQIPGTELNKWKRELQTAFKGVSNVNKSGTKAAARSVREYIEELPEDLAEQTAIKGDNFAKFYGSLLQDVGDKATAKEKQRLFQFSDFVMFGNPQMLVGKKAIDFVGSKLDPLARVSILKKAIDYTVERGMAETADAATKKQARLTLRNLLRLAQKTGVPMTIDQALVKEGLKGAPDMMSSPEEPQATGISPTGAPQTIQGIGTELGAYSPEGAPLYR